jgi:hypothetical protein
VHSRYTRIIFTYPVYFPLRFQKRSLNEDLECPRSVCEVLRDGLLETDKYFRRKRDAAGKLGASTDQKMVCALRQMSHGVPADAVCEYVRVSESTASESLHKFCAAARMRFKAEGFRRPSASELVKIEQHYTKIVFPGLLYAWTLHHGPG